MDTSLQWLAGHPPPPIPAPSFFFFLSSLQRTPITGSKTLPRKLLDSQEIKGVQDAYTHIYYSMNLNYLLTNI